MPALRPSLLRITVTYFYANNNPRVGVPPESVYVTMTNATGGLTVNQGATIYADDSTNASGGTRITVRSFSGCGTIRANLYVSGVAQGYKTATVRTIDPAYSGDDYHVTGTDTTGSNPCDINYSGSVTADDNRSYTRSTAAATA